MVVDSKYLLEQIRAYIKKSQTMQQGTDIYMFNKATPQERAAAMKYMAFLTNKKSQLTWANATGYIPVNSSVVNDKDYVNGSDLKLPKVLAKSMKYLTSIPAIKDANSAYNTASSNLETILANSQKKNYNVDNAIKELSTKFTNAWAQ